MFRYIRYVYEVYQTKSFSKAAKNLYISQPALSAMVKKEEEEIGLPIFDRSTSPITLTEIGKSYILAAEETMNIHRNFEDFLNDYAELRTGSLTLGGANFTASCVYPGIISEYRRKYPHIKIQLTESGSVFLQQQTLSEKIDLIMDSCIFDEHLFQSYALFQGNVLLAVPADFAVNRQLARYALSEEDIHCKKHLQQDCPAVPLAQFQEEPFLLLTKGNDMHDRALTLCHNSGFQPQVTMYLDQLMTTYHMTMRGLGISFVTDTLINMSFLRSDAVYYRIDDPAACRNIYIAHKKSRYITKAMTAFIQTAQNFFL